MEKLSKVTSSGKYGHIFTEVTKGERKILMERNHPMPDRSLVIFIQEIRAIAVLLWQTMGKTLGLFNIW